MALFARATANKCSFINNCCNRLVVINPDSQKLFEFSKHCLLLRCRGYTRHMATSSKHENPPGPRAISQHVTVEKEFNTYDEFISFRRDEAKRSIIVQVQSLNSYSDLYSYCHQFGRIQNIHNYVTDATSYFFIIEFETQCAQTALLDAATHLNNSEIIPVQSQMLWFRSGPKRKQKDAAISIPPMLETVRTPFSSAATEVLASSNSISKQMEILYTDWKLDDVQIRLRFLTALQLQSSFSSLFPNIAVLPFGSSVNGFGKKGCDLDLVMNVGPDGIANARSRLVFHSKSAMHRERTQTQRSMEVISLVMERLVPGVMNVRNILRATVPIIKYDHKYTGLECDLSMTNMTGIHMSELLYLYGRTHKSVLPLMFTIRQWASLVQITNRHPGGWITNFSLSLLVLFFLQREKILPSLNILKNDAIRSDKRITDTCIDATFTRDISRWPVKNDCNVKSLEDLLAGFYRFYANFDFSTKAISLCKGDSIFKPNHSPLYICNPLETTLNVSKNVSNVQLMKFVAAVTKAAMLMDKSDGERRVSLLDIFSDKPLPLRNDATSQSRGKNFRVSELFKPENDSGDELSIAQLSAKHVRGKRG